MNANRTPARTLLLGFFLGLGCCTEVPAGECVLVESEKLVASDGTTDDYFGHAVAMSGEVVVVGAIGDGNWSGAAYVFRHDGKLWVEEAKLKAFDTLSGDVFAISVAVSGNLVLVGATGDDDNGANSGSAYLFRFDGFEWLEEAKLTASDAGAGDRFGNSVAVSGDAAIVGAGDNDDNGTNSGSAYLFRFDGFEWLEEAKLTASDAAAYDGFGKSVAVSGDAAIVGACEDDDNGTNSGSAYLFRFDGFEWLEEAKLTASDAAAFDGFGISVAVSGDAAIVGASEDDDNGAGSGSAYVFRFDGTEWAEEAKLTASDASAGDAFGFAVSLAEVVAVVAAPGSGPAYLFRFGGAEWLEEARLVPAGDVYDFGVVESVSVSSEVAVAGVSPGVGNGSALGSASIFTYSASGQDAEFTASDAGVGNEFGCAVAVSGDVVVVGAFRDDDDGTSSGSTYVYRCIGGEWEEEGKLTASDGDSFDYFGNSVSVLEDVAVVGAFLDDDQGPFSGSAYVFRREEVAWVEEAKLIASDAMAGDRFGNSVSVSGNVAVIGAVGADGNGPDSGAVYVFRHDGTAWIEEAKLTAWDGAADDRFGKSVSVSGYVAMVGAYGDDDKGRYSGSAYVFRHDGIEWVLEAKLFAANGSEDDRFGYSVSVAGEVAVVGATASDGNSASSGAAYLFRCDGAAWVEEAMLTASGGNANDVIGASVAVSGDAAMLGAYGVDDHGPNSGAAFLFRYDGAAWVEEGKLTASGISTNAYFGYSVSVSKDFAVVGALQNDQDGADSGSAFVFNLPLQPCGDDFWIRGDMNGDGSPDLADAILLLYFLAGTGEELGCLTAADANSDGAIDVADAVYLFAFLYFGGTAPGAPFPQCDTFDTCGLACDAHSTCD